MRLCAVALVLAARVAEADDFIGIDSYGTLGLGAVIDHEDTDPGASYDYTLRLGRLFRINDLWRPGGFLELHSFDLDAFDAGAGPQLQLRLTEQLAAQLRAGISVGDATGMLVGIGVGTYAIGGSVTMRRSFDTGDITVSVNLEILALVPVALGIALGAQ